ncbi:thioredoxin-like protein [Gigaspora rosea]|uniref:Thioredoxin-like protein n=1 Tax=Gigaspora rosea TaxID=44941 RepID=A0A397VKJ7_9GLOM|nr:thioredoxin-like protein [Gigaspora rosea]
MSQQDEEKLREEPVDERVQETLDKATDLRDEDDEEKLFEELENDDDFMIANLREQRMEQLKQEMTKLQEMRQNEHGSYTEITDEKEILKITTTTKQCVVHFFHKEFRRCQIMDKHLTTIATRQFKTRFVKINVENAPFLVEKLSIQVLPCVISFIDGISVDRIIGFDDLGNTDSFTTAVLELRLSQSGVITKQETPKKQERKTIFGFADVNNDDDDEWD